MKLIDILEYITEAAMYTLVIIGLAVMTYGAYQLWILKHSFPSIILAIVIVFTVIFIGVYIIKDIINLYIKLRRR